MRTASRKQSRWELTLSHEYYPERPIFCIEREEDPNWRFTDSAGHQHDIQKDNLTPVMRQVWWNPYEDPDGEPSEIVDHWVCSECGERIAIGTRQAVIKPQYVGTTAILTGYDQRTRSHVTATIIDQDEINDLVRRVTMTTTPEIQDRIIQKWIEEHPQNITERRWGIA